MRRMTAFMALLLTAAPGFGARRHVPGQYTHIQPAIDACANGDEVVLAPGTYRFGGNRDLSLGAKSITVRGADPEDPAVVAATVIDCGGSAGAPHRAFRWANTGAPAKATLSGLTIINGYAPRETVRDEHQTDREMAAGGAIFCPVGGLTIRNCVFRLNTAGIGGAIHAEASLNLVQCAFEQNTSQQDGGAVYALRSSEWTSRGCTFDGNAALGGMGGALCARAASIELEECRFSQNSAMRGGAVACAASTLRARRCTIAENRALAGGGLAILTGGAADLTACRLLSNAAEAEIEGFGGGAWIESTSRFSNCLLAGNSARLDGGGAWFRQSLVSYSHCTVAANRAGRSGGGVHGDLLNEEADLSAQDSIFWANTAETGAQISVLNAAGLAADRCDLQTGSMDLYLGPGGRLKCRSCLSADPLFLDPDGADDDPATVSDNDYRLASGSPCIDWGLPFNPAADADDLDGNSRFVDDPHAADRGGPPPLADLGAYERGACPAILTSVNILHLLEGTCGSFGVRLSTRPLLATEVNVSRLNGDDNIRVESAAQMIFTPDNWDEWQVVYIVIFPDVNVIDGSAVFRVGGPHTGTRDVVILEEDVSFLAVLATSASVTVPEGGTAVLGIRLSAQPVTAVQVLVQATGGDRDISVRAPAWFEFTASNWNVYQPVTFVAGLDLDSSSGTTTFACEAPGVKSLLITAHEVDDRSAPPSLRSERPPITQDRRPATFPGPLQRP